MNAKNTQNNKQAGLVSIFIVMFASLLFTVMTVGFVRLMVQEQQQALNNDLSQSAYDSAMSGVEDAKRVLRACRANPASLACAAIAAEQCNTVQESGVAGTTGQQEVTIEDSLNNNTSLSQAYTCVIVSRDTDDVIGNLNEGQSQIVPLRAVASFDRVTIEWSRKGSQYPGGAATTLVAVPGSLAALPQKNSTAWPDGSPAMLRVQAVLATGNDVPVADLDGAVAQSVFLKPSVVPGLSLGGSSVTLNSNRAKDSSSVTNGLASVTCYTGEYSNGSYACKATIPTSLIMAGSDVAFLRLTSLYNGTTFRVSLEDSSTGSAVKFSDVSPSVDSTGRADSLFRRVVSRLNYGDTTFPLPDAAVNITAGFCKFFAVTDIPSEASGGAPPPACPAV